MKKNKRIDVEIIHELKAGHSEKYNYCFDGNEKKNPLIKPIVDGEFWKSFKWCEPLENNEEVGKFLILDLLANSFEGMLHAIFPRGLAYWAYIESKSDPNDLYKYKAAVSLMFLDTMRRV